MSWLRGLPKAALAMLALVVLLALGAAALYGYRMYDYVQHDNDFCLGCHLMVDPYERFARSEHRGLGCKACHQPTMTVRSKMALTQIIKNPAELETHAEVPNERCEDCHVKGNPEEWRQISSSAGHRVHFESDDKALQGLKCVECHSSSVHEFAATDKTCAQSGCHEGVKIQLGKMGKLTLHCAVCHDFSRPVAREVKGDSLQGVLQPKAEECLSCHAMRQLVAEQFTGDDPHNAECGACHNPHEQATPAEAVKNCANSGCHSSPDSVSPMHRGLRGGMLQQCTQCHQAHKFETKGTQCVDCHRDIMNDPPARQISAKPSGVISYVHVTRQRPPVQTEFGNRFSHARHRQVRCESCHDSRQQHGAIVIKSNRDCQSCHHGNQQVSANCANCHQASEYTQRAYPVTQRFSFSVGQPRVKERRTAFDHRPHAQVACAQCHKDTLTRSAENVQCNACHTDHHKPTESCMSCHPTPKQGAHNRNVHVTCSGSGCHSQLPVSGIPRTRPFCIACHQDMVNHKPTGNCADCHRLPAPRAPRTE
ncbi:MAG TPA: NapC/NirT family cytochrome c [Longimicrobiales bacterium]